uniref:uncharacterized protein LOC113474530 n=1 Tax=Ciona intestinalis TaxID=7719 RepID=UPI000EF441A0|nr:uncharacterized protein LOC113474530 [Ciona intestinalis]|eukprot:XP_026691728.1 uncharacterized protein LOC113474530 [Ciona intestinalis]
MYYILLPGGILRLLAEYKVASDRIRSSLRIEQRAKAEAQMWRSKLERIALEHRERLFRQAGSLRYRLRNAEDLLCYHELRERRMQATNEKMKGLIDSVKEEARSLRVESEKRRQATQRNFDEKLSTIACELDRIRSKMDNTRLSCLAKTVTSDPEITSDSTAQITASRASESLSCLVAKKRTVVPTTNSGFSTTVPPVIKHHNILSSLPTKFRRHTVNSGYELKELAQYSRHYNAKFAACSPVQHDRKTNSSSSTSIHASQQNVTGYCNQSTGNACYCCSSNSSNKTPKRRLSGEKSVQINEKTINTTDAVKSLNQIQTRPFTMKTNFARLTQSVTGAKCASCQPNCCCSQEETSHQVPGASDSLSSTPLRNYLIRRSACESTFDTSLHSGRLCVGTINQSMGSPTHSNAHTRTPHAECMCSTFESPISSNCVKMVDNNQDVTARYQVITSYSRNSSAYPSSC